MKESSRIQWLDFMKGLAIITVVFDHTFDSWKISTLPRELTWYSVSLFTLCGGFTTALSISKRLEKFSYKNWVISRSKSLLLPYFCATVLYILNNTHTLNFEQILKALIHFNAAPPLYFVCFYFQLLLIGPVIYALINNAVKSHTKQMLILGASMVLSLFFTRYSNVMSIYGGGGRILGGTYLFMYALGIYFYIHPKWINSLKTCAALFIITGLIFAGLFLLPQHSLITLVNPPGFRYMIYALVIFFGGLTGYHSLGYIPRVSRRFKWAFSAAACIGRYSLEIFFYHVLALSVLWHIADYFNMPVQGFITFYYVFFSLILPIIGIMLWRYAKNFFLFRFDFKINHSIHEGKTL